MTHLLFRHQEVSLDTLEGNPLQTAKIALQAAASGEPEAQALLGQILLDGYGIQQDAALALTWFKLASAKGHAMAANMVGRCLEHGWGCEADAQQAALYYRLAAGRQLDWGMYNLANLLATGRGVSQDLALAFKLYQTAAEMGHAKSMNLVGRYLEEGILEAPNQQAAHRWYERSAKAGDFRGQFSFASVLWSQGEFSESRHWFLQALDGGHLKFLKTARDQLKASNIAELQDICDAYAQRCLTLEKTAAA